MYRKITDFEQSWAYETETTTKLLTNLTDESLNQKVTENGRTLGFVAWHIVLTLGEMLGKVGLTIDCPPEDAPSPKKSRKTGRTKRF